MSKEPRGEERPAPPHRVRDLRGRGLVVLVFAVLVVCAPYAASAVRAFAGDWRATGDVALITMRSEEILHGRLPLVGQPSTADHYMDSEPPDHPGPIEFYLATPFVWLLGPSAGIVVAVGLMNLAAVLTAVWVFFRRGGPLVGLAAAALVGLVAYAQGPFQLTDPISSNMGGITVIALMALSWALIDGDDRLIPAAAFAFAFVAQQHLAIVGLAAGTALWAAIGVIASILLWRRARRRRPGPEDDATDATVVADGIDATGGAIPWHGTDGPWFWILVGLGVSLIAWLPVLVDQFAGSGNISKMIDFARHVDRPSLGWRKGIVQGLRALALPPPITSTGWTGNRVILHLGGLRLVTGLAAVVAHLAIVLWRWRSRRTHAALSATVLVITAIGVWMGSQVPDSVEASRINFYRWIFVLSVCSLVSLAWALAALAARWLPDDRLRSTLIGFGAVLATVVAVVAIVSPRPIDRGGDYALDATRAMTDGAIDAADGHRRVLLLIDGPASWLHTAPAVALELVDRDHTVLVEPRFGPWFGDHNVIGPEDEFDVVLGLISSKEQLEAGPGRPLASAEYVSSERSGLVSEILEQLPEDGFRAEPGARQRLIDRWGGSEGAVGLADSVLALADGDPADALQSATFVGLLRDGLVGPPLPPDLLAGLADAGPTTIWGDRFVELRLMDHDEVEERIARAREGVVSQP